MHKRLLALALLAGLGFDVPFVGLVAQSARGAGC